MTESANSLDAADALRDFRKEFYLPSDAADRPLVYFCGHSLGLQPRATRNYLDEILADWRHLGVAGHFSAKHPWLSYHERLSAGLAALTGADAGEVITMNSVSVNLHLLLASFYRPRRGRCKLLIERDAFPSDRYALTAQIRWHGLDPAATLLEIGPRDGEDTLRHEDICACIEREGATIAVVLLPGIQYLTGQRLDVAGIASIAHKHGCIVGFDLAHAVGNVPLKLHDSNADFAVWCSYKYLNGGPGAIGGAFVHERHARAFDLPRLAGWWGHNKSTRFAMPKQFDPLPGAAGWQVSNPSILSMAPLLASLEIFERATLQRLRDKSRRLTRFLAQELLTHFDGKLKIITPDDAEARGCQLSLRFNDELVRTRRLRERLDAAGVVCDWREPNVMRIAPVPLYNTFEEVSQLVAALEEILA